MAETREQSIGRLRTVVRPLIAATFDLQEERLFQTINMRQRMALQCGVDLLWHSYGLDAGETARVLGVQQRKVEETRQRLARDQRLLHVTRRVSRPLKEQCDAALRDPERLSDLCRSLADRRKGGTEPALHRPPFTTVPREFSEIFLAALAESMSVDQRLLSSRPASAYLADHSTESGRAAMAMLVGVAVLKRYGFTDEQAAGIFGRSAGFVRQRMTYIGGLEEGWLTARMNAMADLCEKRLPREWGEALAWRRAIAPPLDRAIRSRRGGR